MPNAYMLMYTCEYIHADFYYCGYAADSMWLLLTTNHLHCCPPPPTAARYHNTRRRAIRHRSERQRVVIEAVDVPPEWAKYVTSERQESTSDGKLLLRWANITVPNYQVRCALLWCYRIVLFCCVVLRVVMLHARRGVGL